jgi:hypothetical protein
MLMTENVPDDIKKMNQTLKRLHKTPPKPHKEKREAEASRRGSGEKVHDQPSDRPKAGR